MFRGGGVNLGNKEEGESRVRGQSARERVCGNARCGKLGWELQVWLVTCGLWGGIEGCHACGDHCKVFWPVSSLAVTDRRTSYSNPVTHLWRTER